MRKGKELILATKPFAKENRTQSWLYTISTLCFLVSAIVAIYVVQPLLLKAFFSVLTGLLMVRFFVIYHDYQHHTILTKSPLARVLMTIFGLYILAPENIWKRSHDYHHANNSKLFTASIGSFPIVTKDKFESLSRRQKAGYLFIRHPLTILMGYVSMFMLGMCIKSFLSCPRRHIDSLLALILHFFASAAIVFYLGWPAWLFGMLLPFVIAHAFGAYLFYAQHNFPTVFFNDKEGWTYECAALESSSFMRMIVVMRWFTGNIGYHHIHHLNAKIPFYRLPEVMKAFPELQQAKTTSLKLKDIYACLQLKVWDVKNKQMIGLRALR